MANTAALVVKFGFKAGGDGNVNRVVYWYFRVYILVPACQKVQLVNFAHLVSQRL